MLLLGQMILCGKGQMLITTRRRMLILSPGKLLINIGVIGCTMVALVYSTYLGLAVRQSEAAVAVVGTVTNTYMYKNSTQAERRRLVQLFANTFIKSYSNSSSEIAEHGALKVLRLPYPSIREVEKRLGAADERVLSSQAVHLIWNQVTWEKPPGWPGGNIDRPWPCTKNKAIEAWFDISGRLSQLKIFEPTDDDGGKVVEYIGCHPEDWKMGEAALLAPLK
jgi:hypothetical protein